MLGNTFYELHLKLNWHCFKYVFSTAGNSSFVTPLPLYCENLSSLENSTQQAKPKSEPVLSDDASNLDSVWTTLLMIDNYMHTFFKLHSFSVNVLQVFWFGICLGRLLFCIPCQLGAYQIHLNIYFIFCYNAVNSIEKSRWGRNFGISYAFSIFVWRCLHKGEFNQWELLKLIYESTSF